MAEIIDVANAMFKDRTKWKEIKDEEKIKFFFIFNRYFCKKFPNKSQLLNDKLIDSVSAMDTWFIFMSDKPYPKWFWSKSSSKIKPDINDSEIYNLSIEYNLRAEDVKILIELYPDLIKEDIKYFKDAQKSNK